MALPSVARLCSAGVPTRPERTGAGARSRPALAGRCGRTRSSRRSWRRSARAPALQDSLKEALKQDSPPGTRFKARPRSTPSSPSSSASYDPSKGDKDSWSKLTLAFAESAAELDKSCPGQGQGQDQGSTGQPGQLVPWLPPPAPDHGTRRGLAGMGGPPGGGPPGGSSASGGPGGPPRRGSWRPGDEVMRFSGSGQARVGPPAMRPGCTSACN